MSVKDPYLRKFTIHASGVRNWLWGLITFGLKCTQISHKIEVIDSMGKVHELYRKYRSIHYMPWKGRKLYVFRFSITVPENFGPKQIILKRMQPGNCAWLNVGGIQFQSQAGACGKHTLFDAFTWDEITCNEEE